MVSAGLEDGPTALSSDAATRLEALFGADAVRLFPTEVTVLGATTNAEMLLLRDVPGARFLHIELSPSLRAGLPGQPDYFVVHFLVYPFVWHVMATCLQDWLGGNPSCRKKNY